MIKVTPEQQVFYSLQTENITYTQRALLLQKIEELKLDLLDIEFEPEFEISEDWKNE